MMKSVTISIPFRFCRYSSYLGCVLSLAVFAVGLAFAATEEAGLSSYSPHKAVAGFFDTLLSSGPRPAAELAVFPNEEARSRFAREWSSLPSSLAGYTIEGWDVEARKGSAEVSLRFRSPEYNRTLEVGLVKVDGTWKVSPEKASGSSPAAASAPAVVADLEKLLDVTSDRRGNEIELHVVNKAPFSVLLWFDMDLPALLKPDRPLPLHGIVPPSEAPLPLCVLHAVGDSAYRYSWRYSVKRADDAGEMVGHSAITTLPTVAVPDEYRFYLDDEYGYGLPFPADQAYLIWQGPGGAFSHTSPGSKHAVDFSMPLGSEVAAVRDGVVVGVVQKNPDNPDDKPAPKEMANEILVLHADGTMAVYAHLTTDGARVSFGRFVGRGQVIGISGNSGYSRGPHLHFDILGYENGQCVSVPYGFLSSEGTLIQPAKGLLLLAEKDGTCRITQKETTPWRIVGRYYQEYNTEIRYYAKSIEFLAANKTDQPIGVELSFSRAENAVSHEKMPRRVLVPADAAYHGIANLDLVNPGEKSSFSYFFRRVEPPGMEHVPLRVERDAATGYEVETRYFSDRIELYAVNTSSREMVGALDFSSLKNLAPKEKVPKKVRISSERAPQYLATLRILAPTDGYSFRYNIGPWDGE